MCEYVKINIFLVEIQSKTEDIVKFSHLCVISALFKNTVWVSR